MNFAFQGKNPPTKLAAMASASNVAITGIKILGLQIQVPLIILLQTLTTSLFNLSTMGLNK